MTKALMDELRKTLIDLRKRGMPTDKIAETLNLSTDTVIWLVTHLDIEETQEESPADILIDWSTIGEEPRRIALLGKMLTILVAERTDPDEIDAIFGLTYDGVPLAQAVAAELEKPCVIVKTQGDLEFFSAFFDPKGKRIVLVDHVVNTGRTLTRVVDELRKVEAEPLAVFVFVDKRPWRREKEEVAGVSVYSLVRAIRA